MGFREDAKIIRINGSFNNNRNFIYGYNRIKIHNQYETAEHFMAKAMLGFLIFSGKGGTFVSEAEMSSGRCVDIVQITKKNRNLVGYEIENTKNKKTGIAGIDIVEIPLKKMPREAKDGLKALENWLNEYVI